MELTLYAFGPLAAGTLSPLLFISTICFLYFSIIVKSDWVQQRGGGITCTLGFPALGAWLFVLSAGAVVVMTMLMKIGVRHHFMMPY